MALPVLIATTAAAKAAPSILPSSPMSTMPARSLHRPARQAQISGTARRTVEARIWSVVSRNSITPPAP